MNVLKTSLASATGAIFALLSAPSSADMGHTVPDAVSRHNHMHLFGDIIISPSWLVGTGIVVFFVGAIVVRQIRARAAK
ncbi:MAG: hypothetical protein ACI9DC_002778 [Gammaproteobacteria bacterium]|jgi:hypothetical protein